jgi:hypothetical protein
MATRLKPRERRKTQSPHAYEVLFMATLFVIAVIAFWLLVVYHLY